MTSVKIINNYKDYSPHLNFSAIVERLISEVPQSRLSSLTSVVLTNSTARKAKNSRIRSEGRKIPANHIAGLYHRSTRDRGAWIELYVDNIFPENTPLPIMRHRMLQDMFVGRTLFHEIGHHIDYTSSKEQDKEGAADKWKRDLLRQYFKKRYSFTRFLLWPIRLVIRLVHWFLKR